MIIYPEIFKDFNVIAAQSTRLGGVSLSPFSSMNLGLFVNDVKESVINNRELFFGKLGIDLQQIVLSKQVHGIDIYTADSPIINEGYDALITNKAGLYLSVSIADCTPVLIYDKTNKAVAAIHAGWKGTVAEIVRHTLDKMHELYYTKGADCAAYIGACIGYDNFEVGEEVAMHFDASFKKFDGIKQKWFVDLKSANKKQLMDCGLPSENIEISAYCTVKDEELFFSHRRDDGKTGRMMAVIGMKGRNH